VKRQSVMSSRYCSVSYVFRRKEKMSVSTEKEMSFPPRCSRTFPTFATLFLLPFVLSTRSPLYFLINRTLQLQQLTQLQFFTSTEADKIR